tara:strand:+ start:112 stop:1365 length:1254 start_codon:yes stop_codon:yes gene_type:complete
MPKKKIILLSFLFFTVIKGFSQDPKIIDTLQIHEQIKQFGLNEDILNFKEYFFADIVFKNDSTLFYNPNGTLYLFEIILDEIPKVSSISKSLYGGHNFRRLLFIHDDILYSFGGQGLFNNFPGLVHFDPALKGWLENEIKNYPYDAKSILNSWINGNKLMVFLSHYCDPVGGFLSDNNTSFSFGEIDLNKFEYVNHFDFKGPKSTLEYHGGYGFKKGNFMYDSNLYSLHGYYQQDGQIEYRLFDKSQGALKRTSKLDALSRVNGISYLYIKDSTIYYRDSYGKIETFGANSGTIIHSEDFLSKYKSKVSNINTYIIYTLVIMGGLLILFFRFKKKEGEFRSDISKDFIEIEEKLKQIKPTIIAKEELDVLFGISHYSYETIKTRRSLLINQLNKKGNIKIERVRKQDDKRFYDYKIS